MIFTETRVFKNTFLRHSEVTLSDQSQLWDWLTRQRQNVSFDESDLISNPVYIEQVMEFCTRFKNLLSDRQRLKVNLFKPIVS